MNYHNLLKKKAMAREIFNANHKLVINGKRLAEEEVVLGREQVSGLQNPEITNS